MLWLINGVTFLVAVLVAVVAAVTAAWSISLAGIAVAAVAWIIGRFGPSFEITKSSPGEPEDGDDAAGVREPRRPLPAGSLGAAEID